MSDFHTLWCKGWRQVDQFSFPKNFPNSSLRHFATFISKRSLRLTVYKNDRKTKKTRREAPRKPSLWTFFVILARKFKVILFSKNNLNFRAKNVLSFLNWFWRENSKYFYLQENNLNFRAKIVLQTLCYLKQKIHQFWTFFYFSVGSQ